MIGERDYMRRTPDDDGPVFAGAVDYSTLVERMRDCLAAYLEDHLCLTSGEVATLAHAVLQVTTAATNAKQLDGRYSPD